jgi:hypothetical protein
MSTHLIVAIIALVCGTFCGMSASFAIFEMVDKVNEQMPEQHQFAHYGWYWFKYRRLIGEYRRLYPDGSLVRRYRLLIVIMVGCLLISAWGLGFFAR